MNRTTKNYALFMSTKYDQQDPLWLSTKGVPGKIRKLKNTKSFAQDGSNSLRFSIDDPLMKTEIPKSKR
jgi:hypothetical protein